MADQIPVIICKYEVLGLAILVTILTAEKQLAGSFKHLQFWPKKQLQLGPQACVSRWVFLGEGALKSYYTYWTP